MRPKNTRLWIAPLTAAIASRIDNGKNRNSGVDGRKDRDFCQVRSSAEHETVEVPLLRQSERARAIRLGLAQFLLDL
jgi:hypothetical protein